MLCEMRYLESIGDAFLQLVRRSICDVTNCRSWSCFLPFSRVDFEVFLLRVFAPKISSWFQCLRVCDCSKNKDTIGWYVDEFGSEFVVGEIWD